MLTFLYCLDKNYNLQALVSISSILEKIDDKINIIFLHKEPDTIQNHRYISKIKNNRFINSIEFIQFNKSNINFPNLKKSHVSEATYYRLFIGEHLKDYENIVYIDPDIICVNNPLTELKKQIKLLDESKLTVAAFTEVTKDNQNTKDFTRLKVSGDSLFNAGLMIINFKKWQEGNLGYKLVERLELIYDDIIFWDQDVLNSFFNSNYLKLDKKFNHMMSYEKTKLTKGELYKLEKENLFIHYSGKSKPWTVRGSVEKSFKFYHQAHFDLTGNLYQIQNNRKKQAIKDLCKSIINLKIFKVDKPFSLIFQVFKFLLQKR